MRILWTPQAELDRLTIFQHLAAENITAAISIDERFTEAITRLTDFPRSGKPGLIEGTRELIPHRSYRIVYEIAQNAVWILALVHTSRQWPPEAEE